MTGTVTKGLALRSDLDLYDGSLAGSRTDSTGGTTTGLKVGDAVDVLSVYGDGETANQTRATINTAVGALGTANVGLMFAPGTWTIDDDLTIAANFSVFAPPGCVFDVASGKTLTIAGVFYRAHATYSSGLGTVTVSGTDVLGGVGSGNTAEYAVDSGAADVYVIAPSPAVVSYVAGQMFRFKVGNTNTGASTINVSGLGAKAIKQADGATALAAGDLTAGQIATINYEGVDGEFHLVPTAQGAASPAKLDADNVYTKTEIWKVGADVASATALAVDIDGNFFDVTGTTTITSLNTKGVGTLIALQFDGALELTHHATNLILPGAANIATAAGDVATLYEYATGDWRCVSYSRSGVSPDLPVGGGINGLTLSNNSAQPLDDLDIAAGACRDSTNARTLTLSAGMTKQIDAPWAVGDDAGGMFVGAGVQANTWYHVFLIRKTVGGSVDAGFDTSVTAANIPSGYVEYRRLGSVLTDGSSDIIGFTQNGNYFEYGTPIEDINAFAIGVTAQLKTISTPLGIVTRALLNVRLTRADTDTGAVYIYSPDDDDVTPAAGTGLVTLYAQSTTGANTQIATQVEVRTDTSSQLKFDNNVTNTTLDAATRGWIDTARTA